jgi:hypothetical protein
MPGAYAHITLVNLAKEINRLEAGPGMAPAAITALLDWFKYCELGAVSPDYPYLAPPLTEQARWADFMHYERTGEMVKAGIGIVRGLAGEEKRKTFAWLLGYTAHVIADVTIHPVVELKVGPYAGNKKNHRICEMHQDAYIFQRLDLGGIGLSEHLDSGIRKCTLPGSEELDPAITTTWHAMLRTCYPEAFANGEPDINSWHRGFGTTVDLAEEGNRLFPLARHVAVNQGLTYPSVDQIELNVYINNLSVPGDHMSYDEVFDKAIRHVVEGWHLVAVGVFSNDNSYQASFGHWNLDTGKDQNEHLVLWS